MSTLTELMPTDMHADLFLRAVEEGSMTPFRAETLAAGENGELLYAVRRRLNALAAVRMERTRLLRLPLCEECLLRHDPSDCEGYKPSWDCVNGMVGR
jgi:hypothetical protein